MSDKHFDVVLKIKMTVRSTNTLHAERRARDIVARQGFFPEPGAVVNEHTGQTLLPLAKTCEHCGFAGTIERITVERCTNTLCPSYGEDLDGS